MDCMEPTDSASWALASTMRAWVAVTDSATVELRVEFWRAIAGGCRLVQRFGLRIGGDVGHAAEATGEAGDVVAEDGQHVANDEGGERTEEQEGDRDADQHDARIPGERGGLRPGLGGAKLNPVTENVVFAFQRLESGLKLRHFGASNVSAQPGSGSRIPRGVDVLVEFAFYLGEGRFQILRQWKISDLMQVCLNRDGSAGRYPAQPPSAAHPIRQAWPTRRRRAGLRASCRHAGGSGARRWW